MRFSSPPATLLALSVACATCLPATGQTGTEPTGDRPAAARETTAEHGQRYERLLIRNVHVIDGNGTPISGPTSVVVEGDTIARVGGPARRADFYAVIEGTADVFLLTPDTVSRFEVNLDEFEKSDDS